MAVRSDSLLCVLCVSAFNFLSFFRTPRHGSAANICGTRLGTREMTAIAAKSAECGDCAGEGSFALACQPSAADIRGAAAAAVCEKKRKKN